MHHQQPLCPAAALTAAADRGANWGAAGSMGKQRGTRKQRPRQEDGALIPQASPTELEQRLESLRIRSINAETPSSSACGDLEQRIAQFVCARAAHGKRGRLSSGAAERRVLLIGLAYYWDYPSALSFDELPDFFLEYIAANNLQCYNSILCNVYEQKASRIGQHFDDISVLQDGQVFSVSLALNAEDRHKRLADMIFTSPHGVERVHLRHGIDHAVVFDAFEDKASGRAHEVTGTLCPRINLTFRSLDPTKSNMYTANKS
jgi:hypothetical protein